MRNRPITEWSPAVDTSADSWGLDNVPALRLVGLYFAILLPLIGIGIRQAHLQGNLQPEFVSVFSQTREVIEPIPAREGRILAADGGVLADDDLQYDVLMHYRWLEQPPDRDWVRRKAAALLSRGERRSSAQMAAAEARVVEQHRQMWLDLARLTRQPLADLQSTAREIQVDVERVWANVNARQNGTSSAPQEWTIPDFSNWNDPKTWPDLWIQVQSELTRPPVRPRHEPLVVKEQEQYHIVARGVSAEVAAEIETHPERYPGLTTSIRTRRAYPQRDLAAHLLGARINRSDASSSEDAPGVTKVVGRGGLEERYNDLLQGTPGRKRIVYNRQGEAIATEILEPANHGRDLVLTLDMELQRRAERLLDAAMQSEARTGDDASPETAPLNAPPTGACLVAMDVHTGAVLALAAAPRFDANLLVRGSREEWERVRSDPRKPLFPRGTHMALPPGSVFKAITAAALLEAGVIEADMPFSCRGYLDRPDQYRCLVYRHYQVGHGEVDLADALARSCNVYFFQAARRAGPNPLVAWSQAFGIGMPTGIDVPGEVAGRLPRPPEGDEPGARRWHVSETLGLSIGQSSLTVTPLQLARMMAAIANDGFLVTPHLATTGGPTRVEESFGTFVQPVFSHPDPQPIPGLHRETLLAIREGLYRVVQDPHGTGYKSIRLKDVAIAGKTGTAEVGGGRPDHAWFAGYAPAESPRVAFAVVLEHGGSGGKAAGPVAREFVSSLLETGLIAPEATGPLSLRD